MAKVAIVQIEHTDGTTTTAIEATTDDQQQLTIDDASHELDQPTIDLIHKLIEGLKNHDKFNH